MLRRRVCPEDITVGWICALHIELAAALAILDEEYDRIPDTAQYTLGRIGQHDVAVACLPAGLLGTSAAAAVAVDMQRTFPALQYGLMVGIAGGVPSRSSDIRLGDVVISHPQGRYGGVVQYDFGKTGPGGQHLPHGSLNAPHHILLQAVGVLRATTSGGYDVNSILSSIKEPNEFTRPAADGDRLFEASYDHVIGDTCRQCHTSKLVKRTSRTSQNIVIHYGTVASGNQVIKDGSTRDRLSTEHGGVLCFEMEAAGVMNIIPCLIVRGVCDYADSHKNKNWQPFAAAAAAICAKAVLSFVPSTFWRMEKLDVPSRLSTTEVLYQSLESSTPASTREPTFSTGSAKRKMAYSSSLYLKPSLMPEELSRYHRSLRFGEIDSRHATIQDAHSETCWWLLERQEYQNWLALGKMHAHHGFFWIKGHPGTGKSTIMKFVLRCTAQEYQDTTFIKFFFNARGHELEKSVLGMYRSLLFQLLDKLPDLQNVFGLYYSKPFSDNASHKWHVDILQNLFGHAIGRLGIRPLMCFIDALDECEEDQIRAMITFFEHLGDLATSCGLRLHICFSSRHYPHVTIEHSIQLVLERQFGHKDDIAKYVNNRLRGGGKRLEIIRETICSRSSGIFLWVVLVVQILRKDFDRGRMHLLERRLQEIPDGTDELFNDILTRDNEDREELILCLQWILFARRPLRPVELFYGVTAGIDPGSIEEHDPSVIDEDFLKKFTLNSSKGLAELTSEKTDIVTVQFIHESVREYLLKPNRPSIFQTELASNFVGISQERLKLACERYIQATEAIRVSPLDRDNPFLEYAETNALHHADKAGDYGFDQQGFVAFFAARFSRRTGSTLEPISRRFPHFHGRVSPLYVFASNDAANLVKLEVRRNQNIDLEGGEHGFPLNAAIALKHTRALHALLEKHDSPEDNSLGNALYLTPEQRELVMNDAAHVRLPREKTLLCWAAEHGKLDLVKVLLSTHRVHVNARDNYPGDEFNTWERGHGRTPLMWAASSGHTKVVNLLLQTKQLDVETKDDFGLSALSCAARKGHVSVVKTMLEAAAVNMESKCSSGRTPLSYAAGNGHGAVVELLLSHGKANIESTDSYGATPLSWAAANGHAKTLKLLFRYWETSTKELGMALDASKLGLNAQNSVGENPLHVAARNNAIEVVDFLLSIDEVDFNATNDVGQTALEIARRRQHIDMMRLLLHRQTRQGCR